MDYDDNDFQSQNLHIPGEGSTKFPTVLRPYALPKFDLDESLQGHLRFDSLVETEVFLGIESNEDNQWIDAYSRGSSGIEFGSTAAESCSISRHNNVWSEATSSESVEMLLKSVGQEEFIPRETDIQESDACDELACLAKQMEPDPKPDDRNEYKDNVTDLQPPGVIHENLAGLKEEEREQSLAVVSQGELSIDGSLSNLQPHGILGNVDLPVSRAFTDDKSDYANQGKVEIVADGSLEEKTQEDSAASGVKNSITVTSVQSISSTCEVLKIQNVQTHVVDMGHEEQSSLQIQTNEQDLDSFVISKGSDDDNQTTNLNAVGGEEHHSGKPICSIPMEEALESGNVVKGLETSGSSLGVPLGMVSDGISDLQNTERCNKDACFRDLSPGNANEDAVVDNQFSINTSDSPTVAIKDDSSSEGQIVGVSKSEDNTCPNFQKNEGTFETTYSESSDSKENELLNIGNQIDTELLISKSEASIFAVGDNNASTSNKWNNDIKAGCLASLSAVDSTTSCILGEATQVCENDGPDKQGDHGNFCQDISATNLVYKKATSDSGVMHCIVDQPHLLDSGLSTGNMETKLTTATVSDDVEPVNDSDVTPPSRVVSAHGVTDHFEVQGVMLVGSTSIDEKEKKEATVANETSAEATVANEASAEATVTNEASAEATVANEASAEATVANEASAEATVANEASTEAKITMEVSSEGIRANEASSEGIRANEASSEAKRVSEASSEAKMVIESSSEAKRVSEASSEAKIVGEASSEAKIVSEVSSEAKIAYEASSALPVGSSEQETAPCPVTGTEKLHFSDTSRQPLCETISSCVTAASGKMGKPQETQGDKVDQACEKEVGVDLVLCESIEKQGDEVAVSLTKHDKEAIEQFHDKSSSKISGEDLSANKGPKSCSLPDYCTKLHETESSLANHTDNACGASVTLPSQPETVKDVNQVKTSAHLNPSISECINKDALNMSTDHDSKGNAVSKEEISLVPVANLSKRNVSGKTTKGTNSGKRQRAAANKASMVVDESPLASVVGTPKIKVAGNISIASPQISDGVLANTVSQGTPERKPRRSSNNKTAGKETSRKGNKGKSSGGHSERGDRSTSVTLSPSPGFQVMQLNEVQQYGHVDSVSTKQFAILNASTSSLPDLNSSASPPVLFQQPFMDIQQIQLRAQIFVYGALIQGTVPDEAYMISAFGGPDGGRSIWQNAWSFCMERQHGKKSHPMNPETPLQSRSGPRTTDVAAKQNSLQGIPSPLGLTGNKSTPTIANPLIPMSSPLWSLQTPSFDSLQSALARGSVVDYSQALTSSQYQTPPLRNFLGHNTSWLSQTPLRGSWTPIPATDNNSSHISALPLTDTIQFNSVKGSSVPSSIKNAPVGLPASSAGLQGAFIATSPLHDTNNVMVSNAQRSSDPKPKKRKKSMVSEDHGLKAMHLQSQIVLTSALSSHISTAVATATPVGSVPITTVEKSVVSVTPLSLADHLKSDWNVKTRILSDESLTKIKEARKHAEEASTLSAAAVVHSLEIWKQLDKQKNSGLVSDIEAKLASAAVAVAAAAAVAKAAAAAANVASNAALHAKLMADEALLSSGYESSCQISCSEGMSNLGKATPASILKGTIGTNSSSSIIGAAKEAARRRVEAASAARKRAENMDAIVKAAELAAEAVSQAGKIVTLGDPLALNDLVEAGPEGCWNAARESSQQVGLLKDMTSGLASADHIGDRPETSQIHDRYISSDEMGKNTSASEKPPFHTVHSEISQDHMKCIDSISSTINIKEKSSKGPNLVNPVDVLPESEIQVQAASTAGNRAKDVEENSIKEGSPVEVFKDGEGFRAAWYKAKVLSVKDGKAYVTYDLPVDDEGPLEEWISLEGEEDKPPRIRSASNITGLHNEGTRKRQRAAMVDYIWSVGDRVDAWVEDSWQEGVITDQNKKDKTITVHFPVSGKTSIFRAWHLRQSSIWKDGKWTEAPKVGASDSFTHEGDTPHEKRLKLGSPAVEVKGMDRIPKGTNAVESANPGELRLLDLTENDRVFNIGKNTKNGNKSDAHRMVRTGLSKEGSRGIFGVPKPGKKRKFMEVSKHYVADGTSKINDGNDSVKLSNFLIPQGTGGSRGLKNTSKNDTKGKLGTGSRPAFKSGKPQSVSGRVIPLKERTKDSSSHFKSVSQSENQVERASYSENSGAGVGPILYSSLESSHPTKMTSRASKGKLAPAGGGRLAKIDEEKAFNGNPVKSTSDIAEPRRSNRRIQPTSRLLEGLQSSLIISKIPSASHEKAHKSLNRNTSRG